MSLWGSAVPGRWGPFNFQCQPAMWSWVSGTLLTWRAVFLQRFPPTWPGGHNDQGGSPSTAIQSAWGCGLRGAALSCPTPSHDLNPAPSLGFYPSLFFPSVPDSLLFMCSPHTLVFVFWIIMFGGWIWTLNWILRNNLDLIAMITR